MDEIDKTSNDTLKAKPNRHITLAMSSVVVELPDFKRRRFHFNRGLHITRVIAVDMEWFFLDCTSRKQRFDRI